MKIVEIKKELPKGFITVHKQAFRDFFLTSLGDCFLEVYYTALIKNRLGVGICLLDDDGVVIGFAVGTAYSKGFHKRLLIMNIFSFSVALFKVVFNRPKAIFRLFLNLSKGNGEDTGDYGELLSIAVSPSSKGRGYGRLLLREFERKLFAKNVEKIALTTDVSNNALAVNFYKNLGYEEFYVFDSYPSRKMYKMIKKRKL